MIEKERSFRPALPPHEVVENEKKGKLISGFIDTDIHTDVNVSEGSDSVIKFSRVSNHEMKF